MILHKHVLARMQTQCKKKEQKENYFTNNFCKA